MKIYTLLFASLIIFVATTTQAQNKPEQLNINILYLQQTQPQPKALSKFLLPPKNQGLPGLIIAINDSNTTGKFLKHHYKQNHLISRSLDELINKASQYINNGGQLIVIDLPRKSVDLFTQHPSIKNKAIIFNTSVADNELRTTACQTGVLHTAPSYAMKADALAQFLISKRWNEWFLIHGQDNSKQGFTQSLERAAKRFAGKLVAKKAWTYNTDLRRAAQKEVPLFTQARNYDVILTSDEEHFFGEYLLYNSWLARPVAGTQGLIPVSWHPSIEQWGALQLQSRFKKQFKRWMTEKDYHTWLAVRSIAEAVTQTNTVNRKTLYNYMLSDQFHLAAFKGRALSYRTWNGQLRQPISLVHSHGLVSQSPQEGYLHQRNELDTLGFDKNESACTFNKQWPNS